MLRCFCALALVITTSARSLNTLRGGTAVTLDSDDAKSLYALGCNVGRQVGDLDCFTSHEIDIILSGMKDTVCICFLQEETVQYYR